MGFDPEHDGSVFSFERLHATFGALHNVDDTIQQWISTTPGSFYSISFGLETTNGFGSGTQNHFIALFGDAPLYAETNVVHGLTMLNFIAQATSDRTLLTFFRAATHPAMTNCRKSKSTRCRNRKPGRCWAWA